MAYPQPDHSYGAELGSSLVSLAQTYIGLDSEVLPLNKGYHVYKYLLVSRHHAQLHTLFSIFFSYLLDCKVLIGQGSYVCLILCCIPST